MLAMAVLALAASAARPVVLAPVLAAAVLAVVRAAAVLAVLASEAVPAAVRISTVRGRAGASCTGRAAPRGTPATVGGGGCNRR